MNESFLSYECAQFTSQLRLRVLKSCLNITVDLSIVVVYKEIVVCKEICFQFGKFVVIGD